MSKEVKSQSLQKGIQEIIQEVSEDICDHYCKYRDTADEDCVCDYMREHDNKCPLEELF